MPGVATGLDFGKLLTTDDLAGGEDTFLAVTGVTDGELLNGVRYTNKGAKTSSLAMGSRSGTVRRIESVHNFDKLTRISPLQLEKA